jgi:glycosyltransferase involved in cell wall biosynthesis
MRARHDVLFYVPNVGPLLRSGDDLPTGGGETQVVVIGRELARRGLRVAFIVYAVDLPPSVDGIDLIVQRPPRMRLPGVGGLEAWVRTLLVTMRSNPSVVVQANAGAVTGHVALAARLIRRPFVYASTNVVDFEFARVEPSRRRLALFRLGVRLADEVIVQTPEQADLARERFGRRAQHIPCVAETATPRRRTPRAFLWIGRLADYKRPEAYLDLAAAVPEAEFRMVGVPIGPDGARLAASLAERARSLDNFELLDPRPRDELGPLYEDAVAVVNTGEFEGMPNIFLEGWSRGVPALALTHDPDGAIVRERLGAFASGDPGLLVRHARSLWSERDNQQELAARCIAYVRRHHSLEEVAQTWSRVIVNLARSRAGSSHGVTDR